MIFPIYYVGGGVEWKSHKKEIDTKNVKEIDSESRTTFMTTAGHSEK